MDSNVPLGWMPDLTTAYARLIYEELNRMATAMEKLTTQVKSTQGAVESASLLLTQLARLVRDGKDDPAKMEKLATDLDGANRKLSEAVAANTATPPPDEEEE